MGGDFFEMAQRYAGWAPSTKLDLGDMATNTALSPGTYNRTQLDDALALYDAAKARALTDMRVHGYAKAKPRHATGSIWKIVGHLS